LTLSLLKTPVKIVVLRLFFVPKQSRKSEI
jgi:hypothetical protein